MRFILLSLACLFAGSASAVGEDICVRNYLGGDPAMDVCETIGGRYVYVQAKEGTGDAALCAMSFADAACSAYPQEYRYVKTRDGGKVCVVDFNQPGVGNYCEATPQFYGYAEPL